MSIIGRFYSDFIRVDSCIAIEGDELFHLKTVIRGKVGNMIEIINGKGSLVWGKIKDISKDQATAQVRKMYYQEKTSTKILLDIDREVNLDIPWIPPVISVIDPPGDFTPEEKELFKKNDFIPFRLNDSILRTETAAISISAILKMKAGWG